jgi:hypothetical protein
MPNNNGKTDLQLTGVCTNQGCKNHAGAGGSEGDVYKIGYNQVFSTWSNPGALKGPTNNDICIDILGKNADSSYDILIKYDLINAYLGTHPSKPMWLRTSREYFFQNKFHPKLQWILNTEPDVISGGKYNIFRGRIIEPGVEPSYSYLTYVNHPTNEFVDNTIALYDESGGSGSCEFEYREYAYKISVVDNEMMESVKSDKAAIDGYANPCDKYLNKIQLVNSTTKSFSLCNSPNPFNPSTEIRFSIPVNVNVSIKVYNLLGQEIAILVNNVFMNSGDYIVKFDGSNCASGLYLYAIEAGSYRETGKMLLIK